MSARMVGGCIQEAASQQAQDLSRRLWHPPHGWLPVASALSILLRRVANPWMMDADEQSAGITVACHSVPALYLAWLGLAWLGLAWLGLAWLGLAWLGLAWLGMI
jgi:hypothetical protein